MVSLIKINDIEFKLRILSNKKISLTREVRVSNTKLLKSITTIYKLVDVSGSDIYYPCGKKLRFYRSISNWIGVKMMKITYTDEVGYFNITTKLGDIIIKDYLDEIIIDDLSYIRNMKIDDILSN